MDARYTMQAPSPQGIDYKSLDPSAFKQSFLENLVYACGKQPGAATPREWYKAIALTVRDRIVDRWIDTERSYAEEGAKRVNYLSLEFLIGRLAQNNLTNLGVVDVCREAMAELGLDLNEVIGNEPDAALGNGGLGRLAACFLDSMATLGLPAVGYGIRYECGLFEQKIVDGCQFEHPETWLRHGNPWEFARLEVNYPVGFGGRTETGMDGRVRWIPGETVHAVAYDTPVVGYGGTTVNILRLWSGTTNEHLHFDRFNEGDYLASVELRVRAETLSRVLYPNDETDAGRELRLRQEHFFTSASIQDIVHRFLLDHDDFDLLPEQAAVQLNDTHPALAVPELMRQLIDGYGLEWDRAWKIVTGVFSYTNHTLMPEALETWPVEMLGRVLPRHLEIIYAINARFLEEVRQTKSADSAAVARMSLIDETNGRRVRMGNLAFVGSHKVNGVSGLHTDLMKQTVFADFHSRYPDRIINKTNGITPRRWLEQANPALSQVVTDVIGDCWTLDLNLISELRRFADNKEFLKAFRQAKRQNKERLADYVETVLGIEIPVDAMFDVQVKRIHEYKRQLLNALQTIALYNDIKDGRGPAGPGVVKIFAGKAAPSYHQAKLIIRLINDIARTVNNDPEIGDRLKVVFIPNYNVTRAEMIIPAADLSEQISTAGMEASGTGNMKFALNGALTIGTLDGANVEIREHVGADNIFIFGATAAEAEVMRRPGGHDPRAAIAADPSLGKVMEMLQNGTFNPQDPSRYHPIVRSLTDGGDNFLVTPDFTSYHQAHGEACALFADTTEWTRRAVLNTAAMGWFSSDRTIGEYAREIWNIRPPFSH